MFVVPSRPSRRLVNDVLDLFGVRLYNVLSFSSDQLALILDWGSLSSGLCHTAVWQRLCPPITRFRSSTPVAIICPSLETPRPCAPFRLIQERDGFLCVTMVLFCKHSRCQVGMCGGRLQRKGDRNTTASVWNGKQLESIVHGRSRHRRCYATHRLSFVMVDGRKQSTITREMFADKTVDHIILMSDYVGFTSSYLAQQRIRMFRCAVGFTPEASTIVETFPDEENGVDEQTLRKHLSGAMALNMCFEDGRFQNLEVDKAVNDDDRLYGSPNDGLHIIFNAWEDDDELDIDIKQRDVVSDGNFKLSRFLCDDEKNTGQISHTAPKLQPRRSPLFRWLATSRKGLLR